MVFGDYPDPDIIGCKLNSFKEIDEVNSLIETLETTGGLVEKNRDRFNFIFSQYQDQRQLLDPHLESLLQSLVSIIRRDGDQLHNCFKYLYIIVSVKSYKKIVTYLPHEVSDLLPVLKMLEKQDTNDVETWETRYVLLIWLSIISKIPFPLSRLETSQDLPPEQTIVARILRICQTYCLSKDACSVAAVYLISNFLTRSDVKALYLEDTITWCLNCMKKDSSRHGPLAVISSILKHSARQDVQPYALPWLDEITKLNLQENPADLIRKFYIKVVQRVGLVLLKSKLAGWRYQRANRTINIFPGDESRNPVVQENNTNEEQDIPTQIEDIIEQLIQGLRDKVITIRWSAAKGVGKITARLPSDLADEVVGFVLNLFNGRESDSAWHGGCLALAELSRRGLLLPHRLNDVVPVVVKALVFDEPRAYGSIGYLIRDAACYICWSFPRAYDPEIFEPYVKEISSALLVVTCFDREVNCRRAASAAFQENVGRQGNFPHGIDILTMADYFEVGVRSQAYLKISVFIAKFEEYKRPLFDHLIKKKINHWDTAIRELSAKALFGLTPAAPGYVLGPVLDHLLDNLNSIDLNVRHGTVLAIAEIFQALSSDFDEKFFQAFEPRAMDDLTNIVPRFRSRGQFKGLGGELMKQACAVLIKKCARVRFPVHSSPIVEDWANLLEECLGHEVAGVRGRAAEAHREFFNEYYKDGKEEIRNEIVDRYLRQLKSNNQIARIGFAQAVGYFPGFLLEERSEDIVVGLMGCSRVTESTLKWAESRKQALHSLTMICSTLGNQLDEFVPMLYECYLSAMEEYTMDSRGDIGAWVREAAITGLRVLLSRKPVERLLGEIVGKIAQQAVERIDGIRAQAGYIFSCLIHDEKLRIIPHVEELKLIFPLDDCKEIIEWRRESDTFPRFVRMLQFDVYALNLLRGIVFSVGGLSESLVKHSSVSLFGYLKEIPRTRFAVLCEKVVQIFRENRGNERMIASLLAFFDRLLSSVEIDGDVAERILGLLKGEIKVTKSTKLLISSINVFCQLLQIKGPVGKKAFCQLSIFLCHKYTCLRKVAATKIYETLTLYGEEMDITDEDLQRVLTELDSTDWEQDIIILRPIRNELCELMKVPAPVVQRKTN